MKKITLSLLLSLMVSELMLAQNSTCGNAIALPPHNNCSATITTDSDQIWFSAIADSTGMRITLRNSLTTGSSGHMHYLAFYTGTCSHLFLTATDSVAPGNDTIIIMTVNGLSPGSTYYIQAYRNLTSQLCRACTNPSAVFNLCVQNITVPPCPNLVQNPSFESGGNPYCSNQLSTFSIALAAPWSPTSGISPDLHDVNFPLITCLNVNPSPRTGNRHAGLGVATFGSTNFYREFIKQGGIQLVAGKTYKVSFFAKRVDGSDQVKLGSLLTTFDPGFVSDALAGDYQTYLPNIAGYSEIVSLFTCTQPGTYFLTIGPFGNAQVLYPNGDYFFIDDVSITEAPAVNLPVPLIKCSNQNGSWQLNASGASIYNWSASPSDPSLSPSQVNTCCIGVNPSTTTVYTLDYTLPSGCTGSVPFTFTVLPTLPPPAIIPQGNTTLCQGQSLVLHSPFNANYTYSWYLNTYSNLVGTQNDLTATQGGTYILSINYLNGPNCPSTNSLYVTFVNAPPPSVSLAAGPQHCASVMDGSVTSTVSGTSPFTYSWSIGATTPNITGLAAGLYSLFVTDGNGCSNNASATVAAQSAPAAPQVSASAPNLCGSFNITYTISNYNAAFTYVVSGTPAPVSINNPSAGVYTVNWGASCPDAAFTVTAYNVTPACSASVTLLLPQCCPCNPAANDVVVNGASVSSPYLASQLLTNPQATPYITGNTYTNTLGTLYINGYFLVDVNNFTINNSQVRFGGNARVDVAAGVTFNIVNQCRLAAGCGIMWDGIFADNSNETVAVNKSVIEDAQNAIVSLNGGNFTVSNRSQFNKNYKGIVVKNFSYPNLHLGTVTGTGFTCYAVFSNPIPANALMAPHQGERSNTGIEVTDVNDIQLGLTGNNSLQNNYDYMDLGIHALRSTTRIFNSAFFNITAINPAIPNVTAGVGIFSEGPSFSFTVGDLPTQSACNFKNCDVGIEAINPQDVIITGNKFKNITSTGIFVTNLYEPNIVLIRNNDLVNMPNGIWCYNNLFTRTTIFNNKINVGQQPWPLGYGIVVQELFPQNDPFKATLVQDNNIKAVRFGIKVDNLYNRTTIRGNKLTMTNTPFASPVQYTEGIYAANTTLAVITDNDVTSSSGSPDWWMNGIRVSVSSSQNTITCNNTHEIGRGLFFDGPQVPYTAVAKNDMNNGETGLVINGNSGEIGPQGFPGTAYDNKWLGGQTGFSFAQTYTYFANGALSPFTVRPNPQNLWGNPYYPGGTNMVNAFIFGSSIPFSTTSGNLNAYPCLLFSVPFAQIAQGDIARKIIAGTRAYPQYDAAGIWMSRYNLYRTLLADTMLLNSDTLYVHFKDSCDNSNLGKLKFITFVANDPACPAAAVAAASSACGALNPANIVEGHYKTINSILLQHKGTNIPFSMAEINTIRNIALLCPLTDGPGVMYARALMPAFDHALAEYTNSCEQVPGQNSSQRMMNPQQETTNYSFKLYPNPNNGLMQMDYTLSEHQSGELTIYDITGNKAAFFVLQQGNNILKIDEQKLNAGVYLYKVVVDGKPIQQDKIVVIK